MMRLVRLVVGFLLLAAGVAMLALPGPGWATIAAGLAMLATDLPWAKRLLDRLVAVWSRCRDAVRAAWAARSRGRSAIAAATEVLWARDRREMASVDALLEDAAPPASAGRRREPRHRKTRPSR